MLAHPQYLRRAQLPTGGTCTWLRSGLARADGDWRVVSQRTQAPSGLGYLLQNRLIICSVLTRSGLHVRRWRTF